MARNPGSANGRNGDGKGPLWNLPVVRTKELGKLGPGFGFGVGCGVGFGIGLFGGAGLGVGFPGLRLGFGVGAGCGIGLGFGYGAGKGVAYDENRKYTNVGNLMGNSKSVPAGEQIAALLDDLAVFTEKQIVYARKQIEEGASKLEKKFRSGGY